MKDLAGYRFLPELFLRTPFYSFRGYDPARLPEVLADRHFRNAVFLASPEFYGLLEKKNFGWEALDDKARHTLLKYYNRMAFRPTPFGSFAAFSLLRWGGSETVSLRENTEARLHLLPDQGAMTAGFPSGIPSGDEQIRLNPLLYRAGNQFRYIRSVPDEKGKYGFSLNALEASGFHSKLFRLLDKKDLCFAALTEKVMAMAYCSSAEAADYISFLLDEQALFRKGHGSIMADDKHEVFPPPYGSVLLAETGCLADRAQGLLANKDYMRSPYYAVLERFADPDSGPDKGTQAELLGALNALRLLSPLRKTAALESFIQTFSERYDQEWVPLLDALDPDSGIIYDGLAVSEGQTMALDGLAISRPEKSVAEAAWSPVHSLLLKRWLQDGSRSADAPVVLTADVLDDLEKHIRPISLPPTFPVMYRQTADHLLIESAGGVSANTLGGRFSLVSEEVLAFCRRAAEAESAARPGAVHADIGLLTDLHVDNINRRRNIYSYEITLNTFSVSPAEQQIRPSDLFIAVREGELVLWSARLKKQVVPRLASAYNYRHSALAVFRLLCDMQHQGMQTALVFDPEEFFPGLEFYPRFQYERTVISLARWVFNEAGLAGLLSGDDRNRLLALIKLRERVGLPRMVAMGMADQQLVFDLSDRNGALFFLRCLTGKGRTTVTEYLEPDLHVRAGGKPLAGQYIAFLAARSETAPVVAMPPAALPAPGPVYPARVFSPGSEWLYLKVYCSPAMADRLLAELVNTFLKKQRSLIKSWFFIRYHDPAHHLRLRFRSENAGVLLQAFAAAIAPFVRKKMAREFIADSYRRELERYGPELIGEVEQVFRAGSELALSSFKVGGDDAQAAFKFGLSVAYGMLRTFLPEISSQADFAHQVAESFQGEFAAGKKTRTSIDTRYRELKRQVDTILSAAATEPLSAFLSHLKSFAAMAGAEQRRQLLADLIHMQMNRTFSARQRQHEYLVYEFLKKYLAGRIAREKNRR